MRLKGRKFWIPLPLQYRLRPFLRVGFFLKQILHRLADEGITSQFSALCHALESCPDLVVEIDVEIHLRSLLPPDITAHKLYQAGIQRNGGDLRMKRLRRENQESIETDFSMIKRRIGVGDEGYGSKIKANRGCGP
jgi:hypothetical protein